MTGGDLGGGAVGGSDLGGSSRVPGAAGAPSTPNPQGDFTSGTGDITGGATGGATAGVGGRTAGGSADVDLGQVREAGDKPRSTISTAEGAGRFDQGTVEGKVRGEAGGVPNTDVKAQADAKVSGMKPEEAQRAEAKAREVESVGDRVRNPDAKAEVSARVDVDDQVQGRVSSAQSTGGEARSIANDPGGAARSRATNLGEGEVRAQTGVDPSGAKGQVDSAANVGRDPKSAVEGKVRGEVDAEVNIDASIKKPPTDPTK